CVPHDLIKKNSKLNLLYKSTIFKKFLIKVLNLKYIFPYADPLSSINYNYYQKNQQLGWHFDNATFAITLMIQSADRGGEFEYVSKGRDFDKKFIDKLFISKIINKLITPEKINAHAGTLVLFYGRNYLHRVTPVTSNKSRILVTLNYNEQQGICLSENARLTFFGRIN
ncbi:2OG-Fe(II) oxygenase, partial [Pelagibacteraceae bacterium]|nr:2OG-Fe(II) oxygenase [Pelagibacteraceae bacterium]